MSVTADLHIGVLNIEANPGEPRTVTFTFPDDVTGTWTWETLTGATGAGPEISVAGAVLTLAFDAPTTLAIVREQYRLLQDGIERCGGFIPKALAQGIADPLEVTVRLTDDTPVIVTFLGTGDPGGPHTHDEYVTDEELDAAISGDVEITLALNGLRNRYTLADPADIVLADLTAFVLDRDNDWSDYDIREIGQMIHDPVEGGGTGKWVWTYSGRGTATWGSIGMYLNDNIDAWDGWAPAPTNPIIQGDTNMVQIVGTPFAGQWISQVEDSYLAKNRDGTMYRDSDACALLFAEGKIGTTQFCIVQFRSDPGTLDFNDPPTIALLPTPGWSADDVNSPVVLHIGGGVLKMLYEGRNGLGQQGQIGLANSADEGQTPFVAEAEPIIVQSMGDATWHSLSLVPDDVIEIGEGWYLIGHGQDVVTEGYSSGRHATLDDPADWDASSFDDAWGNTITPADTLMCVGNRLNEVVHVVNAGNVENTLIRRHVIDHGWDRAREERIADTEAIVEEHDDLLTDLLVDVDDHENRVVALETAGPVTSELPEAQTIIDALHPITEIETDTGTDIADVFSTPDFLDPSSDLVGPNFSAVLSDFTGASSQGILWNQPATPAGKMLVGVRFTGLTAVGTALPPTVFAIVVDGTFTPPAGVSVADEPGTPIGSTPADFTYRFAEANPTGLMMGVGGNAMGAMPTDCTITGRAVWIYADLADVTQLELNAVADALAEETQDRGDADTLLDAQIDAVALAVADEEVDRVADVAALDVRLDVVEAATGASLTGWRGALTAGWWMTPLGGTARVTSYTISSNMANSSQGIALTAFLITQTVNIDALALNVITAATDAGAVIELAWGHLDAGNWVRDWSAGTELITSTGLKTIVVAGAAKVVTPGIYYAAVKVIATTSVGVNPGLGATTVALHPSVGTTSGVLDSTSWATTYRTTSGLSSSASIPASRALTLQGGLTPNVPMIGARIA